MPKRTKASIDDGTKEGDVTRSPEVARLYARLCGITALDVACAIGTKKALTVKDTEFIKNIVATYLEIEASNVAKGISFYPDIEIAYSVWHPDHKYGSPLPAIYQSVDDVKKKLESEGLWPLRFGWRVVQVVMRRMPEVYK